MQMLTDKTVRAATVPQLAAAASAPRPLAPGALVAIAGGLNPQPLPPFHEPDLHEF
jgi:hypothetical protein